VAAMNKGASILLLMVSLVAISGGSGSKQSVRGGRCGGVFLGEDFVLGPRRRGDAGSGVVVRSWSLCRCVSRPLQVVEKATSPSVCVGFSLLWPCRRCVVVSSNGGAGLVSWCFGGIPVGGHAGGYWSSSVPAPRWWLLVGGSVVLLRRCRGKRAALRSGGGSGVSPRTVYHKEDGFATGELLHKAVRQRGGLAGLRLVGLLVLASGGCSGGLGGGCRVEGIDTEVSRVLVVICFISLVLCVMVCGQLGFQCLPLYAYVPCTAIVYV